MRREKDPMVKGGRTKNLNRVISCECSPKKETSFKGAIGGSLSLKWECLSKEPLRRKGGFHLKKGVRKEKERRMKGPTFPKKKPKGLAEGREEDRAAFCAS